MTFRVLLTEDAERDLREIDDYITSTDSPEAADYVLDNIEKVFLGLAEMPTRGSYTKELLQLGIREYREVYFKPYRIVYRIQAKRVYVYLIADGRREMRSLLARRLLEA
jgi:toxin ParE1/3/4